MKYIKQSNRKNPKTSLILLDWSVRESFHLLHYLSKQDVSRDDFEVIIIEYYSRVSSAIKKFEDQVDTWVLLEMPTECYYHKHLMYNAGIVLSRGEIIIICDSDAMVKPTFIRTVIDEFENNQKLILHLDQFRNKRKDLYPFNYPSFEEVIGSGCINYSHGMTTGVYSNTDPLHNRNYGTCFCARRKDLIAIGGADEHIDFVGHICGPYDLTFRLINYGAHEKWSEKEFLYHTWHPGQDGVDNYLGSHDGRNMSTTALEAISTRRVQPHVMNEAIQKLQQENNVNQSEFETLVIHPSYYKILKIKNIENKKLVDEIAHNTRQSFIYKGYIIEKSKMGFKAYCPFNSKANGGVLFESESLVKIKVLIGKQCKCNLFCLYYILRATLYFLNFCKAAIKKIARSFRAKIIFLCKSMFRTLISPVRALHFFLAKFKKLRLVAKNSTSNFDTVLAYLQFFREHKKQKSILIMDEKSAFLMAKFLCACYFIRNLKVVLLKSEQDIRAFFQKYPRNSDSIIVGRAFYFEYRSIFQDYVDHGQVVIL